MTDPRALIRLRERVVSTYNWRWRFSNGVRWARLGHSNRGFGFWEQRIDKAKPARWPGPLYEDGPPDPEEWYERSPFPWEWPVRPYLRIWSTSKRRVAVLFPMVRDA